MLPRHISGQIKIIIQDQITQMAHMVRVRSGPYVWKLSPRCPDGCFFSAGCELICTALGSVHLRAGFIEFLWIIR